MGPRWSEEWPSWQERWKEVKAKLLDPLALFEIAEQAIEEEEKETRRYRTDE